MRTSWRSPAVPIVLVAVAGLSFVAPAAAERRAQPQMRTAARAIVHGRDAGVSRERPTSFELFSQRSRPASTIHGSSQVTSSRAPTLISGFDALADPFSVPSDTTGALGTTHIVTAVNTQVAVYDRTGAQVVAPIQLDALHADTVGHFAFDPKVIYDQYNDTFLVVYLVQEDSPRLSLIVTVAIPDADAEDTGTWCSSSFHGDALPGGPAVWADYPGVGYTDSRVTITTNQFTFPSAIGRFRSSQVMTIDKLGLYDCDQPAPIPTVFAGTQTRDDRGRQAFTLRPAETVGASPGAQLMLSFAQIQGRLDYVTLWRIRPTASGFALKRASDLTGRVSSAPLGTQGGGGVSNPDLFWDTGDTRLINTFYDADRKQLFAAHAVFRNLKPDPSTGGYAEAAIRWYEIDPAAKLKDSVVARRGVIGAPEVDVGWPSVATDGSGTLFVTYSRASAPRGEFLSAWVATIPPGATTATQSLLRAGSARYDAGNGPERWGDYTALNRDPLSSENLATFNQYASSPSTWQQFVSMVTDN